MARCLKMRSSISPPSYISAINFFDTTSRKEHKDNVCHISAQNGQSAFQARIVRPKYVPEPVSSAYLGMIRNANF